MSHTIFLIPTPIKPRTSPTKPVRPFSFIHLVSDPTIRRPFSVSATSSPSTCSDHVLRLQRCLIAPMRSGPFNYSPQMKDKQYGSSGTVTLEKSKINISRTKTETKPPELASGSGNGNNGKSINTGGGGGDDGGDDDDDNYYEEFDDGDDGDDGGLFKSRIVFSELFDRKFVDSVLKEWQKTMMDLPPGLRQAYEMGLVSSNQLVRFFTMNSRRTTARFISRLLPQGLSRAFIGRMIADPAFLYRLLIEEAATIGCSVWWEVKNRGERIKQEWDLALINVLTVSACNAAVVWSLAPCRSYGNAYQFDLQNTLQKLPNNIFENSYLLREFDLQKRIHSFFYKAAELCVVGLGAGTVQSALSLLSASKKKERLSVTMPTVSTSALGYGAFLGLFANMRYQLLCGAERALITKFDVIGVTLFFSTALRILNVQLGETWRLGWLGVGPDPLSDDLLNAAYKRPSEPLTSPSDWLFSKDTIVNKHSSHDDVAPPKRRRRRIVKKKMATSSA